MDEPISGYGESDRGWLLTYAVVQNSFQRHIGSVKRRCCRPDDTRKSLIKGREEQTWCSTHDGEV